jgi:TrmH family RNA methyltransferase
VESGYRDIGVSEYRDIGVSEYREINSVYHRLVPPVVLVSNRQHPIVKRCRTLALAREAPAVLLDGEHLVADAVAAGLPLEAVLTDERPREVTRLTDARGVPRYEGTRAVLAAASPVRTTTGIVAIARWVPSSLDTLLTNAAPLIVALVDVQDPGNVGSVIRTAEALGASGVMALGETADPGGWKALRGAMASTFRLPVARGTVSEALAGARTRGCRVAATMAGGGDRIDQAALHAPLLLLLGNEGAGLDRQVIDAADVRLSIPMAAAVNSLNVSVTAALCLWEAQRQRLGARGSGLGARGSGLGVKDK